jgi:hypothetical protein
MNSNYPTDKFIVSGFVPTTTVSANFLGDAFGFSRSDRL